MIAANTAVYAIQDATLEGRITLGIIIVGIIVVVVYLLKRKKP